MPSAPAAGAQPAAAASLCYGRAGYGPWR